MSRDARNTILVVEDDDALRDLYVDWLDAGAFEVESAATGAATLDALDRTDAVDIVLLDRWLPDAEGDDVLRRIRGRGYSCKVAMVTGTLTSDDDVLDRGFDASLTKPVSRADLMETIRRLLGGDAPGSTDDSIDAPPSP